MGANADSVGGLNVTAGVDGILSGLGASAMDLRTEGEK